LKLSRIQRYLIGYVFDTITEYGIALLLLGRCLGMEGSCPVMLVNAVAAQDGIVVSIQNMTKVPIRRIEFTCKAIHPRAKMRNEGTCLESNVLFFPGNPYELKYPYPDGIRQAVSVSLRSVTLDGSYIWKPSRRQSCRILRIYPHK